MIGMRKKALFALSSIIVLVFFSLGIHIVKVYSLECTDISDVNQKIECLKSVVDKTRAERNTLTSEIQYMDSQIALAEVRIQETQNKIVETEKEIGLLGARIEGLDGSLDYLSKLLLRRIVTGYKKNNVDLFDVLLNSDNADDLINRAKYLKTAQNTNQKLLVQVQETKLNFEEQKKIREEKKIELDKLQATLREQQESLNVQKSQKQRLLAETQNSESVYQQLLSQARAQVAAFKSFVQTSGASSVVGAGALGSGSDGNYFSQRDERWAYQYIGNSSENILNVGCLLTSIAMVLKKNGVSISPPDIASNTNYFSLNTAFMKFRTQFNPWPGGLNNYQISVSQVDDELAAGRYVIAGINFGACSGSSDHFVVLTKKDGDDYIMHDPIYGPDIKFSSHYSQVCWAEVFR